LFISRSKKKTEVKEEIKERRIWAIPLEIVKGKRRIEQNPHHYRKGMEI